MTELSRTFDLQNGAVVIHAQDSYGNDSYHTFYVAGIANIDTEIANTLAAEQTQADAIRAKMIAAGWTP
jgi:hypothetical protein